ncbi:hypothetical protein FRB96_005909 [Tulasnella sp. 330]|nr:hypothetical protein FRB96_005909 [Tulasnella sp. 330]
MFADLLQGLGAVFSAKWAADGRVICSAYCSAQGTTIHPQLCLPDNHITHGARTGLIQQLGETGVAMNTLVITLHTFAAVFFRWHPARQPRLWMFVVALIWMYSGFFVILGYTLHTGRRKVNGTPYFGPTPFWCWIGPSYLWERIFGEYFWLWFCALVNVVAYPFLFFTLRGNIEVDPTNWRRIRFRRRGGDGIFGQVISPGRTSRPISKDEESVRILKMRNKEAMKMFWYPLSYTILVLPLSITRWSTFRSKDQSATPVKDMSIVTTSAVLFVFGLSGLVNVLLFLFTRPNLLLFNIRRDHRRQRKLELLSSVSFNRAHIYPNPNQVGLHRRRTQEEDWGDLDDEIMNEEYDRASSSPYQLQDYPPPPNERAPPPPLGSTHDLHDEVGMKAFSDRYGSRAISTQSVSSGSFSLSKGPPPTDGQVMRSTSSLGQVLSDGRSHSAASQSVSRVVSRMASFPPLSEYQAQSINALGPSSSRALSPSGGLRSAASWTHPSRGGSGSYQQYATPSRIGKDDEERLPSPTSVRGMGWSSRDEYPGMSSPPLPPPQPPTPIDSVYSRSARVPPFRAPPENHDTHEDALNIQPPPEGYPPQLTAKEKVKEWALRSEHDRLSQIPNVPETPRPPT